MTRQRIADIPPFNQGPDEPLDLDPTPVLLSGPTLARRGGITYRQLHWWVDHGVIYPTVPPQGSGSRAAYAMAELEVILTLAPLLTLAIRGAGIPTTVLRAVAMAVREHYGHGWVRLEPGPVATIVTRPYPDGCLYLPISKNPAGDPPARRARGEVGAPRPSASPTRPTSILCGGG